MSAPATISNGDIPDATVLMTWFNFLAAGKGIKTGTYNALVAVATGTDPFWAIATDSRRILMYVGDATAGDGHGFVDIGGW